MLCIRTQYLCYVRNAIPATAARYYALLLCYCCSTVAAALLAACSLIRIKLTALRPPLLVIALLCSLYARILQRTSRDHFSVCKLLHCAKACITAPNELRIARKRKASIFCYTCLLSCLCEPVLNTAIQLFS